jgi:hypothetical protein
MKSLKKFEKSAILQNHVTSSIFGGGEKNNSDVAYTDCKADGGKYDIAVLSLIDIVDSSKDFDYPTGA